MYGVFQSDLQYYGEDLKKWEKPQICKNSSENSYLVMKPQY